MKKQTLLIMAALVVTLVLVPHANAATRDDSPRSKANVIAKWISTIRKALTPRSLDDFPAPPKPKSGDGTSPRSEDFPAPPRP